MSRSDLAPSNFADFYEEVHGRRPFDWQDELARTVCEEGKWPRHLDMPTASGKTSVIDIAVFHLALEGRKRGRRAPLRIAFVVDRRLVVDGALEHAQCLAAHIAARGMRPPGCAHASRGGQVHAEHVGTPPGPVTRLVSRELEAFSPGHPLKAVRLRGGMPQDTNWARTPSQPTIIVSTVDQVGSRLLFRGYGVSDSMKPVHAGLLGSDTLFLLDEAHMSRPFLDTLARVSDMRSEWREEHPIQCMFMSATLGDAAAGGGGGVFPAPDAAERLLRGDASLSKRLDAHKWARLVEVAAGGTADAVVAAALDLAYPKKPGSRQPPPRNVGVVVNRVGLARQIYGELFGKVGKRDPEAEVHLLTGRARPLERDRVVGPMIDRVRPAEGAAAVAEGGPATFYVATQSIEVGVDVDFDALVTQAAPLDSLRQRFGRLDRIGTRSESDAVIVAAKDEIAKKSDDPIYGDRIPKAWAYLRRVANKDTVDFGVFHFPLRDGWDDAVAPRARSATLMPSYVRMWSQTRPRPRPDPDPAVFLHGVEAKPADVQVVWRADVTDEMLREDGEIDLGRAGLTVCRPSQLEAISLPVWIARRWLGGQGTGLPLVDLEGSGADDDTGADNGAGQGPCALLWHGARDDKTGPITADQIRPGNTIVVPVARGGCDRYGWDEKSRAKVTDLGMDADLIHRHALTFRLGGAYLSQACPDAKESIERLSVDLADEDADMLLDALAGTVGIPEAWSSALGTLRDANSKGGRRYGRATVQRFYTADGRTVVAGIRVPLGRDLARKVIAEVQQHGGPAASARTAADGGEEASYAGEDVEGDGGGVGGPSRPCLSDHCRAVAALADKFCKQIGMGEKARADVALAARLHDAGKAERRVQAFLHRSDPDDLAEGYEVIAKSGGRDMGRAEHKRIMRLARLPEGYRHECWSVRLAESHPEFQAAHDADLVRYLIGTHHGHGRPLFPPVADSHASGTVEWTLDGVYMKAESNHGLVPLDSGWIDMCDRLYQKYGPWRLAHMEAVVRLADHRVSGGEEAPAANA